MKKKITDGQLEWLKQLRLERIAAFEIPKRTRNALIKNGYAQLAYDYGLELLEITINGIDAYGNRK